MTRDHAQTNEQGAKWVCNTKAWTGYDFMDNSNVLYVCMYPTIQHY